MDESHDKVALDVKLDLMRSLDVLAEDIRSNFNTIDIISDIEQREQVSKEMFYNISSNLRYIFDFVWEEYKIHHRIMALKKIIQLTPPGRVESWRPKIGDIKQQLRSINMHKKIEYKTLLQEELSRKRIIVNDLKSEVSQQRIKSDELQKHLQTLCTKKTELKEIMLHR